MKEMTTEQQKTAVESLSEFRKHLVKHKELTTRLFKLCLSHLRGEKYPTKYRGFSESIKHRKARHKNRMDLISVLEDITEEKSDGISK